MNFKPNTLYDNFEHECVRQLWSFTMPSVSIRRTYVVQKQKRNPIKIDGWNDYVGDKREGHK
jgi:hypothetical protein